ncbi:BQ2448_2926 [Microbotryum intermedium]|uniref:BQ2448_2926 protein n=1 Tax=Microbotryum intermedium TaxID=269621 RepID=A0A238FJI3_9BASI|nr:BQ2448_2926 [Microbotryum intermedium]
MTSSPPQGPKEDAAYDDHTTVEKEGPKYPWTLAPPTYQQGLESRILTNLVPLFRPFFEALQEPSHPTRTPSKILELASGNGTHVLVYAQNFPPTPTSSGKEKRRNVVYQPTECDPYNCRLVDEKTQGVDLGEEKVIRRCRRLDLVVQEDWERLNDARQDGDGDDGEGWDLVMGHNFIHMVPWSVFGLARGVDQEPKKTPDTDISFAQHTPIFILPLSPQGPTTLFQRLRPQMRPQGKLLIYGPMKSDQGYFSENDENFDTMIRSRPGSQGIGLRSIQGIGRLAQENGWVLEREIAVAMGNWVLVFVVKE